MDNGMSIADLAAVTNNGNFAGNEFIWIFALLILFGGGGMFGWGNRGDYGQFATAASQQEILFGQQFQSVLSAINKVGDGLASLGYSQLQQMDNNTASINSNVVNEGRSIQSQIASCCCENQKNVDSVRFDMSNYAAAINKNIDDKFAQFEKTQMQAQIDAMNQEMNRMYIAQQMCGVPKINSNLYGIYPYNNSCPCANV